MTTLYKLYTLAQAMFRTSLYICVASLLCWGIFTKWAGAAVLEVSVIGILFWQIGPFMKSDHRMFLLRRAIEQDLKAYPGPVFTLALIRAWRAESRAKRLERKKGNQ